MRGPCPTGGAVAPKANKQLLYKKKLPG